MLRTSAVALELDPRCDENKAKGQIRAAISSSDAHVLPVAATLIKTPSLGRTA
jgi:hypothetical protein